MNGGDKQLEDCYYYLYSSCKKGQDCIFRHNPKAKMSTKLCPEWEQTKRCTADCPLRHNTYQAPKKKADDYCYFEDKEQGCTKPFCEFKHKNPDKDTWKLAASQNNLSNDASSSMMQEDASNSGIYGRQRGSPYNAQFFGNDPSETQNFSKRQDNFQRSGISNEQSLSNGSFDLHQEYDLIDNDAGYPGAGLNDSNMLGFNSRANEHSDPSEPRHSGSIHGGRSWFGEKDDVSAGENQHPTTRDISGYAFKYDSMDARNTSFRNQPNSINNNQSKQADIQRNSLRYAVDSTNDSNKFYNEHYDDRQVTKNSTLETGVDKRKRDSQLSKQNSQAAPKQSTTQLSEPKDKSKNRKREEVGGIDRNKEARNTSFEGSDKSYFKRIRLENKTLLNEIEDVEREIDDIECRISRTN